ncbi:AP-1 complex subunit gamma-2 [Tetrabaena socialis]|uniref:AP-1 complex subunit gamma-2 n=1 Tax=Tetrabaena socialis TaxID=47790 RepID=A0A2J7ZXS8_9CHLO|nr:AP-1 complex subunit gamma-2 [Tetrabaena socialis]|eukprot:PNH05077.1 AP-1 complex subunit gamma-2 [Tetrabaena socialis]
MTIRLRDLIKAVRASKTAAEEREVIAKESAALREAFRDQDQSYRHRNVAKLMYIHMLGYATHFGQMETLKLIAGSGFPEKRMGYLGLMILLDERQEVLMLVTNSVKMDLNNTKNMYIVGLALVALGNICSAEMARDLAPDVEKLMDCPQPYIRKKAALCAIRVVKKVPDLLEQFVDKAVELLNDRNQGVVLCGVSLMLQILEQDGSLVDKYRPFVAPLCRVLRSLLQPGVSPEHDIGGITNPFLQAVQRHRATIVECVKDADVSIRRRALELVYSLVNEANIRTLTRELLDYLAVSDAEFKPDLTAKICMLIQRLLAPGMGLAAGAGAASIVAAAPGLQQQRRQFAPDRRWHVDQLLAVMLQAGLCTTFALAKHPTNPALTEITAVTTNSNFTEVTDFALQAAVPKFMQLKLDPASGTVLPPRGGSISQKVYVNNTQHGVKTMAMRLRISFASPGGPATDVMAEVVPQRPEDAEAGGASSSVAGFGRGVAWAARAGRLLGGGRAPEPAMRSIASPGLGRIRHEAPCQASRRAQLCTVHAASLPPGGTSNISPRSMKIPNQADSVFNPREGSRMSTVMDAPSKSVSDLDYLSELLAIQQSDGPKHLGFFGTRNMGVTHQKLVEVLSYAYATTGNHIYTSGATGTNAAVIKGALRANCPDKLTVLLPQLLTPAAEHGGRTRRLNAAADPGCCPQSLHRQPYESQELLQQVENLVEMPENDTLPLLEASRICNRKIISHIQQVVCFAFHDSRLLLETCQEAKEMKRIVTLFYLD